MSAVHSLMASLTERGSVDLTQMETLSANVKVLWIHLDFR